MKFIPLLRHKLKLYLWLFKAKNTDLDFLGEAIISVSARWHGELNPLTSYVCMLDTLRQRNFSGNFLELGGGYSTVILPNILDSKIVSFKSVDLNPDKYNCILNSVRAKNNFMGRINNIQKPTVTLDEIFISLETLRLDLQRFDRARLSDCLKIYVMGPINVTNKIVDCIYAKDGEALRALIMCHHAYTEDLKFYKSKSYESGFGYCHQLVNQSYKADAIFFDCGEISSVAEWVILSSTINVGGYALLHDIYYPKSIKNFLVATYIELSEDWSILYRDAISAQGGMVALRCK